MDLKDIGINTRKCVYSAQDRNYLRVLVNAAFDLWVPKAMKLVIITIIFFLLFKIVTKHTVKHSAVYNQAEPCFTQYGSQVIIMIK